MAFAYFSDPLSSPTQRINVKAEQGEKNETLRTKTPRHFNL